MSKKARDVDAEFFAFVDSFADDSQTMTDEEVRDEAKELGVDLTAGAKALKTRVLNALDEQRRAAVRARLDRAREERLRAQTRRGQLVVPGIQRIKDFLTSLGPRLAVEHRNFGEMTDADLQSLYEDYKSMQERNTSGDGDESNGEEE